MTVVPESLNVPLRVPVTLAELVPDAPPGHLLRCPMPASDH